MTDPVSEDRRFEGHEADGDQSSPVLTSFLSFLDQQIRDHPELVRPFTARDIEGLDDLLRGVEVDLNDWADDEFTLP